jgi:3-oxoacyl-[acyl-carrier protein] reductase
MPAQQRAIGDNDIVADPAIVSHMAAGHQEVVRAEKRFFPGFSRAMYRYIFAEHVVALDSQPSWNSAIFEILRRFADDTTGEELVVLPNARISCNIDVRTNAAVGTNLNALVNHGVRSHADSRVKLCLGMDNGRRMNHATKSAGFTQVAKLKTNVGVMETHLRDRVVLITGASGGIGSGIARKFAEEGARLVLHYLRGRDRVAALQRELKDVESLAVRADLSKEPDASKLLASAIKRFGRVDTLVANAGSWETRDVPLYKMSLRQWRQTLDGVLTTTFFTVREFLRLVAKQRRGNLTLVGSTAAVFGEAGHADYAAGKAATVYGLTRSLKNEIARLAPHTSDYCGGRANCVCPGWTVVPRLAAKLAEARTIRKVTSTMALPQLARPADVANAVVFLSSDTLARHITGEILLVAGGMEGRQLWQPAEINTSLA